MDFLLSDVLINTGGLEVFDRDRGGFYTVRIQTVADFRGKERLGPNGKKISLSKSEIKNITRSDYDKE